MSTAQAKLERAEALCREVRGELEKKDVPPTYCGLTAEQWQKVVDLRGLVEVQDNDGEEWDGPYVLEDFIVEDEDDDEPFRALTAWWLQARLALIPGHIVPWFGGECPVGGSKLVSVQLNGKIWVHSRCASAWTWAHGLGGSEITAFIFYDKADLR